MCSFMELILLKKPTDTRGNSQNCIKPEGSSCSQEPPVVFLQSQMKPVHILHPVSLRPILIWVTFIKNFKYQITTWCSSADVKEATYHYSLCYEISFIHYSYLVPVTVDTSEMNILQQQWPVMNYRSFRQQSTISGSWGRWILVRETGIESIHGSIVRQSDWTEARIL